MGRKQLNPYLDIRNNDINMINQYLAGGYDADAQAFLTAAGITDGTISSAINTLVLGLKSNSLWDKMKAIYPFVGGTATTHKFNLKDPRDLDAAYRLTFYGGWTHDINGITGNGSNTYADTFLVPNLALSQNSGHLSIYIRNNTSGNYLDMGSSSSSVFTTLYSRYADKLQGRIGDFTNITNTANTTSIGFYQVSRISATDIYVKKNSNSAINGGYTSLGTVSNKMIIGNLNNNGTPLAGYYSNRNYSFASIDLGMTETDMTNLYTLVQAFQTSLGRQV
jgi:hypothetical protein